MAISRKSHKKTVRRSSKKILKGGEPTEIHILYSLANYSASPNHIQMLAMSKSLQNLLLIANDIFENIQFPMWEHGKKLNKTETKFKSVLQNNMVIDTIIIDTENPTHKWQIVNLDSIEKTQIQEIDGITLSYQYDQSYKNPVFNQDKCKIPSKTQYSDSIDVVPIDMYERDKTGDKIYCLNVKKGNNTDVALTTVVGRMAPETINGVIKSVYTYDANNKSIHFDGHITTENSENDIFEAAIETLDLYNPIPMKLEISSNGQLQLNLVDDFMPEIISFLVKNNLFDDDGDGTGLNTSKVLNEIVKSGYNEQYLIDYMGSVWQINCESGEYTSRYNNGISDGFAKNYRPGGPDFETYVMMRFMRFFYEKYPLKYLAEKVPLFRLINIPYMLGKGNYGPATIEFLKKNINITPDQLLKNGLSIPQIRGKGPSFNYTLAELTKSIPLNLLLTNGITNSELEKAGIKTIPLNNIGLTALQLKNAGFSLKDLVSAKFSIQDLLKANFSYDDLLSAGISIQDLFTEDISIKDLISGGVHINTLLKLGVPLDDIIGNPSINKSVYDKAGIELFQLKGLRITALQLKSRGYSLQDLISAKYSINDLISAGYSIQDLLTAGISIADMAQNGITVQQLFSGGVPLDTIFKTGIYTYSDIKDIYKANVNKYPDLDKVIQLCSKNILRKTNLDCKYNPSNGGVIEDKKVYPK